MQDLYFPDEHLLAEFEDGEVFDYMVQYHGRYNVESVVEFLHGMYFRSSYVILSKPT